ncbi:UDP-N-acetylglucosamine:LPS N-acetylglucosamine transferase [Nocardioides scoriae]|uniref:UDP-N-acetylglucosamine:LPS N-acetylglucosamine transferase n=1 Tax=Nocardioides scoriae TaxID=642780 RepID=A0A1H1R2D0_9ACTN|nr:hypothetical protein [Nocardioides scoriae]SDS29129.1 UDP-N-acetylglucosamine:LPS N-acetylglucosamine transferase [Nocardioides scoriae]
MIGYYVHHQGRGHVHRALAVARARARQGGTTTGLSSAPRPEGWPGAWVRLPLEDVTDPTAALDPRAGGQLHWVPRGDEGLMARSRALSEWLASARPRAVVVDVSVEVALLVRLHGVPVVTVVQPGQRDDAAHLAGYRASSALVAPWPADAETFVAGGFTPRLPVDVRSRIRPVGAISRLAGTPVPAPAPGSDGRPRVLVLQGRGGAALTPLDEHQLEQRLPHLAWTVVGGHGRWVEDPTELVAAADVVVMQAGLGSLADVAAVRRPAVLVASPRPFDEQLTTARVLAEGGWPVVVAGSGEEALGRDVLDRALALDGDRWAGWTDPGAADHLLTVVDAVALPDRPTTAPAVPPQRSEVGV